MNLKNIKKSKYLNKHKEFIKKIYGIETNSVFNNVVVIPVYDEYSYIEKTLDSLYLNNKDLLNNTLILIVVNNPDSMSVNADIYKNNKKTLLLLKEIKKTRLNLAWIDCSSKGFGLKGKGGVGVARKIGIDSVLNYLNWNKKPIIFSLDADTIVSENYLNQVTTFFNDNYDIACATIPFEHLRDGTKIENNVIDAYEFYLKYYVNMLKYAGSPYAYHAIGSAMAFRGEAYIKAGGMKVNTAGEDFYFLQDVRKIGLISELKGTKVFQSSRSSDRVPFGTGPTIIKHSSENTITLYNPKIFRVLKEFLEKIEEWILNKDPENIQFLKENISNESQIFLKKYCFDSLWPKILRNNIKINSEISETECRNKLLWCFNIWFDAFKTLKFVHFMERSYPDKYSRITIDEFKKNKMKFLCNIQNI